MERKCLINKVVLTVLLIVPIIIYPQINDIKPYSLEKDNENNVKIWEMNCIKSPSDSIINIVLNTLRNGNEEDILNCFQKYIFKINNRKILETIDSMYFTIISEVTINDICDAYRLYDYKEAIPKLIISLDNENISLRYTTACTLAALGEKERCLQVFKTLWKEVNWQDKQGINRGLRNIGTIESINILIDNTKNENSYVACGAAICLAQIGHYKEAFPVLKQMLSIDDRKVSAIIGLAYIGDKNSLDIIYSLVNDKDPHVRSQSKRVLKAYGYSKDKEEYK